MLVDSAVNRLRLASKLKAMASGSGLWPDLPCKCPEVWGDPRGTEADSGAHGGKSRTHKTISFDEPSLAPEDIAFLQFTSGSTSEPKGVMLTFGNVEYNVDISIRIII